MDAVARSWSTASAGQPAARRFSLVSRTTCSISVRARSRARVVAAGFAAGVLVPADGTARAAAALPGAGRADLSWADLSWADLSWADLSWADLSWAGRGWATRGGTRSGRDGRSGPCPSAGAARTSSAGVAATIRTRRTTRSNTDASRSQNGRGSSIRAYRTPLYVACHIFLGTGEKPHRKCQSEGMASPASGEPPDGHCVHGSSWTGSCAGRMTLNCHCP
ncbi:pentapeptide repeat-containing protein [Actinoplanes sp. NPDC023714]|uniref:pentapeptide repeat-containing protein n=1 Tax=Actinoplanes sp. NPDC023714 TaxID=3154322 RepID=UPI003402E58C